MSSLRPVGGPVRRDRLNYAARVLTFVESIERVSMYWMVLNERPGP